jgi:nucleotide-binding universal stress UspA family protein
MRVLVATDGSAPSTVGVQLAAAIAWPADTTIRVMTAIDTGASLFGGPWPTAAMIQMTDIEGELRAYAKRTVEAAAQQIQRAGVTVEPVVVEGRPATAIVEEAGRFGAELVIVGARGHGAIEEMVLGSVSAEVLDTAAAPVLIARQPQHQRILLAWDGSPSAEQAASLLETWPVFRDATVRVVTVTETDLPWWAGTADVASPEVIEIYLQALDEARAERRKIAESMASRLQAANLTADAELREGGAGAEILAAADAWGAELILMGTRARTGLARLALGSVARNVVHHAKMSVLVTRQVTSQHDTKPEA